MIPSAVQNVILSNSERPSYRRYLKIIMLVGYLIYISAFVMNGNGNVPGIPSIAYNSLEMGGQIDGSSINGDYIPSYALWTHLPVGENRQFFFLGNNSVQIQQTGGMEFRYEIDSTVENTTILLDVDQSSSLYTNIEISPAKFQSPFRFTSQYQYRGKLSWNIPQIFQFTFNNTQISGYLQFDLTQISSVQKILSSYYRNHLVPIVIDQEGHAEFLDFESGDVAAFIIPLEQFSQSSFQIAILTFDFGIHPTTTGTTTTEPGQNRTTVIIVISVGILVVLLITVISSENFRYYVVRYVAPNRTHHRLDFPQVFDNENRQKIIELLLSNPGIHYNELKRITNLSAGQLSWHLDLLESYGIISSKRIGQYVMYFPILKEKSISEIDLMLMKSPTTKTILNELIKTPGIHANTLAQRLNLARATIKYHIDKLLELNYIRCVKIGRKIELYPIIFPSKEIK